MTSFIVNVKRLRLAAVLLIVSVSLVALISTTKVDNRNHFVVHGFHAPSIRQARTTTTANKVPSFLTTTAKKGPEQQSLYNSGCRQDRIGFTTTSIATTRSSTRLNSAAAAAAAAVVVPSVSSSFLSSIPSVLWWILGHNILANAGLPFVVNGSKVGGWYSKIDLPSWIPNKKLFGPVWTCLYTLMGIAVSRIFSSTTTTATAATSIITKNNILLFWAFHYSINITWASIFFGLQRFRLGLIVNYVLVATLGMIVPLFYTIDKISALLLLPYTIWLLFATYLNVAICKLNPTDKDGYNDGMFHAQLQKLQENAANYAFGV